MIIEMTLKVTNPDWLQPASAQRIVSSVQGVIVYKNTQRVRRLSCVKPCFYPENVNCVCNIRYSISLLSRLVFFSVLYFCAFTQFMLRNVLCSSIRNSKVQCWSDSSSKNELSGNGSRSVLLASLHPLHSLIGSGPATNILFVHRYITRTQTAVRAI